MEREREKEGEKEREKKEMLFLGHVTSETPVHISLITPEKFICFWIFMGSVFSAAEY